MWQIIRYNIYNIFIIFVAKYCFQNDELDILLPLGKEIPCLEVASFVFNSDGKFIVHLNVGSSVEYQAYDFHQVDLNGSLLEIQFDPPKSKLSKRGFLHDASAETVFCVILVNKACEIWSLGICKHHYWFSMVDNKAKIVTPVLPGKEKGILKRLASQINIAYNLRLQYLRSEEEEDLLKLDQQKLRIMSDMSLINRAGGDHFDNDMLYTEDQNETVFPEFDNSFKNVYSDRK